MIELLDFLNVYSDAIRALATVFGAASAFAVAVVAQSYAKRTARMQFIFASANLVNDWNKTVLSNPAHIEAIQSFREAPSESFVRDYLMFNLLTYLETIWRLKQENVYRGPLVDSEIDNILAFFNGNRAYLAELLGRGYGEDFTGDMLKAFDRRCRAS